MVLKMSKEVSPTNNEIIQRTKLLAENNPNYVKYNEIGLSVEGRSIIMLTLGDISRDLPIFMATGGVHGDEECGREIAISLAEWIIDNRNTYLDSMSFIIIPCVNPDGSIRNSRYNSDGVDLCRSFLPNKPAVPLEASVLENVLIDNLPDCYVDIHGLAGGSMGDYQFIYSNLKSNSSAQIGYEVSDKMDRAARQLGFPTSQTHLWGMYDDEFGTPCMKYGKLTNALCMVIETTENYYPMSDSVKSALVRLQVIIEYGLKQYMYQPYCGFPCDAITGGGTCMLMPYGNSFAERRKNRYAMMQGISQDYVSISRQGGDPNHTATIKYSIGDKVTILPNGFVVQASFDRRVMINSVKYVSSNGVNEILSVNNLLNGYSIWNVDNIILVRVNISAIPTIGDNIIVIDYDVTY